jgi:hypothetical protein
MRTLLRQSYAGLRENEDDQGKGKNEGNEGKGRVPRFCPYSLTTNYCFTNYCFSARSRQ